MSIANFLYIKERIVQFYGKHDAILNCAIRFLAALISLLVISDLYYYSGNMPVYIVLGLSLLQAILPISALFYIAAGTILYNMWFTSLDLFLALLGMILVCWLLFVRIDQKYAAMSVFTIVLFYLKLEFLIPVIAGITIGYFGILPTAGGMLLYYTAGYVTSALSVMTISGVTDVGAGAERLVRLLFIDRRLLVMELSFCVVIFTVAHIYRLFHERAWQVAILSGSIALAFLVLIGKLIFELKYSVWAVLFECILGAGIAAVIQTFQGIGDTARMEKATFEDETYIYYVKAVPKIRVSQLDRSVQMIHPEKTEEERITEEIAEKVSQKRKEIAKGKEEIVSETVTDTESDK